MIIFVTFSFFTGLFLLLLTIFIERKKFRNVYKYIPAVSLAIIAGTVFLLSFSSKGYIGFNLASLSISLFYPAVVILLMTILYDVFSIFFVKR